MLAGSAETSVERLPALCLIPGLGRALLLGDTRRKDWGSIWALRQKLESWWCDCFFPGQGIAAGRGSGCGPVQRKGTGIWHSGGTLSLFLSRWSVPKNPIKGGKEIPEGEPRTPSLFDWREGAWNSPIYLSWCWLGLADICGSGRECHSLQATHVDWPCSAARTEDQANFKTP